MATCNPILMPISLIPRTAERPVPTVAGPSLGRGTVLMARPGAAVTAMIAASARDLEMCYEMCNAVTHFDT